jgi:hypothetical protein
VCEAEVHVVDLDLLEPPRDDQGRRLQVLPADRDGDLAAVRRQSGQRCVQPFARRGEVGQQLRRGRPAPASIPS